MAKLKEALKLLSSNNKRSKNKTLVNVTWDMSLARSLCDATIIIGALGFKTQAWQN